MRKRIKMSMKMYYVKERKTIFGLKKKTSYYTMTILRKQKSYPNGVCTVKVASFGHRSDAKGRRE